MLRAGLVAIVAGAVACVVSPLAPEGRPCGASSACGPGTTCDPVRGVCVRTPGGDAPPPVVDGLAPGGELGAEGVGRLDGELLFLDAGCPAGTTVCGAACVNTIIDPAHCGGCNKPCPKSADRCDAGKCVCGKSAAPCGASLSCVGGTCVCGGANSLCDGCCDGNTCVARGAEQNTGRCGKGGAACKPCPSSSCGAAVCQASGECGANNPKPDGTPCDDGLYCTVGDACKGGLCVGAQRDCSTATTGPCDSGACDETQDKCAPKPKADETACVGGLCYGGSCCTGCFNPAAKSCEGGTLASACGDSGFACVACVDSWSGGCAQGNPKCSGGGHCQGGASNDQAPCDGGAGTCWDGGCCAGCWDGARCRAGSSDGFCGAKGTSCADCTSECRSGGTPCVGGACSGTLKPDGVTCSGGLCYGGRCCSGCWDGKSCWPGTATSRCGKGGVACKSCTVSLVCKVPTCSSSGSCGIANATNGSSCAGGTCLSGSCCTGCVGAGLCRAGTSGTYCGKGGAACVNCTSLGKTCSAGTCILSGG